ncbi:MAG: hypothetical protein K8S54_06205 [Spirochaetia bacterium]|nr:hypothetical protein [Spirochaetia bacterium]
MASYSFRIDPRLQRVARLVLSCYRSLKEESARSRRLREFMPEELKENEKARRNVRPILEYFGLAIRDSKNKPKLKRPPAKYLVRRWRALHLVFWRLTSLWYPDPIHPSLTKKEILELLTEFGLSPQLYEGIKACLSFAGFTTGIPGSGGFSVVHPAHLSSDLLNGHGGSFSVTTAPFEISSEYSLYDKDTRPLVRFVQQHAVKSVTNYSQWVIRCDRPGGKPIQKSDAFPDRGTWQNPDLVCVRAASLTDLGMTDTQILSVEVKLSVDMKGISEAESFLEFSNYVYLAVAAPFREVLRHSRFLRTLVNKGIGLILLKRDKDYSEWLEMIPPIYRAQSNAVIAQTISDFGLRKTG